MTAPAPVKPKFDHEKFCPVVVKSETPRMETFPYLGEDPVTGRSRPTHEVTRCLDCGAATYKLIGA